MQSTRAAILAVLGWVFSSGAAAQSPPQPAATAGRVLAVAGEASVERGGQKLTLSQGHDVRHGDLIAVGERSALQIRFSDESLLALRANTQLRIQEYRYASEPASDSFVLALLRGGLRTITGLIGKGNQRAYGVQTPTATVGIRGTHFSLVACQDDCSVSDGSAVPNGLYGGVSDGRIAVTNQAGEAEFEQQENFYLAGRDVLPQRLLVPPAILVDRALVVRARSTTTGAAASTEAAVDSKTEQRASTQLSTSGMSPLQRLLAMDLQTLRTLVASGQYPGLVDLVTAQSNQITYTLAEASNDASGQLVARTEADNLTVRALRNKVDGLRDKFFYNAETAAAQLSTFMTVGGNRASGVFWAYEPPKDVNVNGTGSHIAFGDTPRVAMPGSGTAVYNFLGGTTPTDSLGRTGVLSAGRLSVDFASRTITNVDALGVAFARTPTAAPVAYGVAAGRATWGVVPNEQTLNNLSCVGCTGTPTGTVTGRFVGTRFDAYAASFNFKGTVGGNNHVASTAAGFGR